MPSELIPVPPQERLIPDCCNTGVVFRILLFVNGVALLDALLHHGDRAAVIDRFLDAAPLVEFATLLSLVLLCGLARPAAAMAPWMQRLTCVAVPAAVAGLMALALSRLEASTAGLSAPPLTEAMLTAGVLGGLLQHYFELRQRAYSPVLVEARLQALQARIRPHFLFNSLNAALSLVRTEPMRAEAVLEDLADLFRIFMRDARDMTTLDQEIQFCKKYLAIEQIRLGPRLHVVWLTEGIGVQTLRRAQIPALLLQPLVENAVHYGVEPATEPATIAIRLVRSIDRIEISVTNPYHEGVVPSGGNHMALNNIRQRLALLYDVEGHLAARAVNGRFEVHLRFPYVKTVESASPARAA